MTDKESRLRGLRDEIDAIDDQVLELLNRRASVALEVGRVKKKDRGRFHVLEREEAIYKRLTEQNAGPFPSKAIRPIFREIISASLSLEKVLTIACLGPEATFSHLAALQQFGESVSCLLKRGVPGIFDEVIRGRADYGVVPIENSTEGVVNLTLDMFIDSEVQICAEVMLEISHCFLSMEENIEAIKTVFSHPQAIAQCYNWIQNNLSHAEVKETFSTAMAAQTAKKEPQSAAIASEYAGKTYGLPILKRKIEDNTKNYTRFWVIGPQSPGRTGNDKTSLMFSIKDGIGALHSMLHPFAKNNINLTKIESRPVREKPWAYIFFIDIEGHIEDKNVKDAINELSGASQFVKVLGSYPRANST